MSHIQRSIIYDDKGRPIGVVLPYEEWVEGQKKSISSKRMVRASDLKGKLGWEVDPVEFQRQVREECNP